MCILFIYRNPDASAESYRLIVATNREEYLIRPAKPAHYWEDHPECLGGIDMELGREGGTWFALSTKGRAGAILNLTGETRSSNVPGKGRGCLISNYITSEETTDSYLQKLHQTNQNGQPYNPFNLVLIEFWNASVYYLTSSEGSEGPRICEDNILGFGNSMMDQPYKKVQAGKEKFKRIIENATISKQDSLIKDLLEFLKEKESHLPDPELQRRSPKDYTELSSIFVCAEKVGYGTRTHSILLVNGSNQITFVEETLMPNLTWKCQTFKVPFK